MPVAAQTKGPPSTASNTSLLYPAYDDCERKKTPALVALKINSFWHSKEGIGLNASPDANRRDEAEFLKGASLNSSTTSLSSNCGYLDMLDARDEDSFTLETFEALILKSRAANKHFILARVTTVDPHDATKHYHSHYPAHLLNKILFRTQPEAGLLHRMKCRNPRNNMEIIGQVDYFTVSPDKVDHAVQCYEQAKGTSQIKSSGSLYDKKRDGGSSVQDFDGEGLASLNDNTSQASITSTDPLVVPEDYQPAEQRLATPMGEKLHQAITDHGIDVPQRDQMVVYEAVFYATDDTFLNSTDVREFFKRQSLNDDDYLLFTLFRLNGAYPGMDEGIPISNTVISDPTYRRRWFNLWGFFMPLGSSLVTYNTGFINPIGWLAVSLMYAAGIFGLVKYVLPAFMTIYAVLGSFIVFLLFTCFFVRTSIDL